MGKNTINVIDNGVIVASTTFDIFDFAPIVTVNSDEEGENVMFSVEDCTIAKKEKLELGDAFDEDVRTYIIPELVIAKNSTAKVPIQILQGYDPVGPQDNDGIVVFSCSNTKVTITVPDGTVNTEEKTIEKEVSYGDEFEIEISHTLGRGEKFSIDVKGKDDDDTMSNSELIVTSGKLNFSVVEKDVFMKEEIDKVKDFLIENASNFGNSSHMDCITTVNHTVRLLLGKNLSVSSRMLRTMNALKKQNKVKTSFTIDYLDKKNRTCSKNTPFKANTMKGILSEKIKNTIKNRIGFHFFGIGIMDSYHSLLLTVINIEPCNVKYILSDQNPDNSNYNYTNGWKEFTSGSDLDNWILHKTKVWHESHDSYAGTDVWKLQR